MLLSIVLSFGIAGSGVLADSISLFNPDPGAPVTAYPAGVRSSLPTSKTKRNKGGKQRLMFGVNLGYKRTHDISFGMQ